MRINLLLLVALASACTKHNPESCCTTDAQCQSYGLDGIIGCSLGEVCTVNGACVASQCTTSADCTDPTQPICINQVCVASCTTDADCTGASTGPHCGSAGACVECDQDSQCTTSTSPVCDAMTSSCRGCQTNTDCGSDVCDTGTGACVQCTMDSQCPATAPVCDATTDVCRGCAIGTECPSDVCLEATGTCADQSDVRYVNTAGSDSGTCTKASPCATVTYAISQTSGATRIVHIQGGNYAVTTEVDLSTYSGTIDAESTQVSSIASDTTTSVFAVSDGTVTFSNMTLTGDHPGITLTGGNISLYDVDVASVLQLNGGAAVVERSTIDGSMAVQNASSATLDASLVHGLVNGRDGTIKINATTFDDGILSGINFSVSLQN